MNWLNNNNNKETSFRSISLPTRPLRSASITKSKKINNNIVVSTRCMRDTSNNNNTSRDKYFNVIIDSTKKKNNRSENHDNHRRNDASSLESIYNMVYLIEKYLLYNWFCKECRK